MGFSAFTSRSCNRVAGGICLLGLLAVLLFPATGAAKSFKVALFIPGQSSFWNLVTAFMEAAAEDLDVDLRVYDAESNHFLMVKQVEEAISGPDKVDAIVFQNFKKRAPEIIKLAEDAHVYAYLFNSPIEKEADIGRPREKYRYWLGEMLPDDKGVAEVLANSLIRESIRNGKIAADGTVHVIGISGRLADTASLTRISGLENAVNGRDDVKLRQVFNTDWGQEQGAQVAFMALKRYPETTVVWSANYKTSNGILRSLERLQLSPGEDIFLNSYGLRAEVLDLIAAGDIVATTGGHYIESAWVLVQLYDYFNGIDFREEGTTMRTPMPVVTKKIYLSFRRNYPLISCRPGISKR